MKYFSLLGLYSLSCKNMLNLWWRPVLIGALYLLAWYGLDVASQQFATSPEVTVWYPAVGLDAVLLLVVG